MKKPKKITKAKLARKARSNMRKALIEWSRIVRQGGKCEICGRTEFLDAHHILPKERYPALKLDPRVGICCCKSHHKFGKYSFHRNAIWSTVWLMEHKPEQYAWVIANMGNDA